MNMTISEALAFEEELETELKAKNPNHPALKYYGSTWKAIDAYYEALYGHKFFGEERHLQERIANYGNLFILGKEEK